MVQILVALIMTKLSSPWCKTIWLLVNIWKMISQTAFRDWQKACNLGNGWLKPLIRPTSLWKNHFLLWVTRVLNLSESSLLSLGRGWVSLQEPESYEICVCVKKRKKKFPLRSLAEVGMPNGHPGPLPLQSVSKILYLVLNPAKAAVCG